MKTGAKEIQQVYPSGPNKQQKHQTPIISSIEKSLSRNCHRVRSPTNRRAIKEESKVVNRDWADRLNETESNFLDTHVGT